MSELSWICQVCGQAHYDRGVDTCVQCLTPRQKTIRQIMKGIEKRSEFYHLEEEKCYAILEGEGILLECSVKDRDHLKKGIRHKWKDFLVDKK